MIEQALQRARDWALATYPAAVVRRFFELELLDKSFGLAAQAFVALLPLVIVAVALVIGSPSDYIAGNLGDRFGLDQPARTALQLLFSAPSSVRTISWLAVAMSLLSAFSLSKRLSKVYASIVGQPSLRRQQAWRGLVWIGLQVTLFIAASSLRSVRRDNGPVVAVLAIVVLIALWFLADMAGLRLLVPSVTRRILVASAVVCSIGRIGLTLWAAVYMPKSLSEQAQQYGPIGVTFSFFTFILVSVVVYLGGPLLAVVWFDTRDSNETAPPLGAQSLVAE